VHEYLQDFFDQISLFGTQSAVFISNGQENRVRRQTNVTSRLTTFKANTQEAQY